MNNFELYYEFYSKAVNLNNEEAIKFFYSFFINDNLDAYLNQFYLSENESLALETLFDEGDLKVRVLEALKYDEYCFEALLISTKFFDDEDYLFDFYHNNFLKILSANNLSEHAKENAILFLNLYADFLLDVSQSEDSLMVQKEIVYMIDELEIPLLVRMIYTLERLDRLEDVFTIYMEFRKLIYDPAIHLAMAEILYENNYLEEARVIMLDVFNMYNDIIVDGIINQDIERIIEQKSDFDAWVLKLYDDKRS